MSTQPSAPRRRSPFVLYECEATGRRRRLRLEGGDPVAADPPNQELTRPRPHHQPLPPASGLTPVDHQSGNGAVEPDMTHPLIVENPRHSSKTIAKRPEIRALHGHEGTLRCIADNYAESLPARCSDAFRRNDTGLAITEVARADQACRPRPSPQGTRGSRRCLKVGRRSRTGRFQPRAVQVSTLRTHLSGHCEVPLRPWSHRHLVRSESSPTGRVDTRGRPDQSGSRHHVAPARATSTTATPPPENLWTVCGRAVTRATWPDKWGYCREQGDFPLGAAIAKVGHCGLIDGGNYGIRLS